MVNNFITSTFNCININYTLITPCSQCQLTHWVRVMHICISKLTIIGWDNGLSSGRCQAIIWTNAWLFLIGPTGTNFNEIIIKINSFSFKKIHLKMSPGKWWPFCLGHNVLSSHEWYGSHNSTNMSHITTTKQNKTFLCISFVIYSILYAV